MFQCRLDFLRSLVSGLVPSGEERGLLSRTAAGDRAYYNVDGKHFHNKCVKYDTCVPVVLEHCFDCTNRYLTSERSEQIHEKRYSISTLFCSFHRHTTNDILVGLPKIYDHFLKFTEEPLKVSGVHTNVSE